MTTYLQTKRGALALTLVTLATAGAVAAAAETPNLVLQGRQTFFTQCHGCHTLGAAGTPIAYDLSHIGAKYSRAELERWLRDPSAQKPTAHMPRLDLTEPDVRALAAYLSTLK